MNDNTIQEHIKAALGLKQQTVKAVLDLLNEGCTIPFIARYRKDRTLGADEVQVEAIQQLYKDLKELQKRKEYILETIAAQGKLTDDLRIKIENCYDNQQVEDLYLPYKQRKKTKADLAREAGLEPLAKLIWEQKENNLKHAVNRLRNGKPEEEALAGARDIIAEWINENALVRNDLRERFKKHANLFAKVIKTKAEQAQKYRDYFDYAEKLDRCPGHRIMAVFRGVDEGLLRFGIEPDIELTMEALERKFLKHRNDCGEQVKLAIKDAYKRLLQPSLETEFKNILWERAEQEAIRVFADNLKQLLLSAPLGSKNVLAIDPGIRTGCKVVCLDNKGNLLKKGVLYIHEGSAKKMEASEWIKECCNQFSIEAFAIGDGTAGRETQEFVLSLQLGIPVFLVNEDGASVYSASEVAREEFPSEDITVRGTVSIGRRLMDPLAELVKIDPKAIGVGQYQHDVNPSKLKEKLDQTVVSCVNMVGVNLNTAGKHLLAYVSGLGPVLAQNIVDFRLKTGKFRNRKQLLEVPRLGEKVFEQCAGFLRIVDGDNPLDASGVHPESYKLVAQMAADMGCKPAELIRNEQAVKQIQPDKYVSNGIGVLGVNDILNELLKPGLDPRDEVGVFQFASNIYTVSDLKEGMVLPGIVSNITAFGAFVDIGIKQDGLVHISHLANRFVKDPNEVVKLQQKVLVKVLDIDTQRGRVSLSMKDV